MLCPLDRLRSPTLAIVALISLFVAATVVSPYIPGTTIHAQQVGSGGVPGIGSEGSGGAVSSVFARAGAVAAAVGDYTCTQVTNCVPINGTNNYTGVNSFPGGDLFLGGVNAQTGTTYAFLTSDENKIVTFNNASAVAVTLSAATTTGFTAGAYFGVLNLGAGTVTITPTTSTINGATTLTLATGQSAIIWSNGTNYVATGAYAALTNQANNFGSNSQTIANTGSATNGWVVVGSGNTITFGISGGLTHIGDSAGANLTASSFGLAVGSSQRFAWSTGTDAGIGSPAADVIAFGNNSSNTDASATVQAKLYQAGVGTQLTAAATIAPTFQIHHITGATQVTTITAPAHFAGGQITLIPDDVSGQSTGTGGNIALGTTMIQHKALTLTYDGTNWYPSY